MNMTSQRCRSIVPFQPAFSPRRPRPTAHSPLRPFLAPLLVMLSLPAFGGDLPPAEPLDIGREPQFVFDRYVVDNVWAIRYKREAVERVFHQLQKHAANPLLTGNDPSFMWVVRDAETGLFRMWYQANL